MTAVSVRVDMSHSNMNDISIEEEEGRCKDVYVESRPKLLSKPSFQGLPR